jgi:hypothetical protein
LLQRGLLDGGEENGSASVKFSSSKGYDIVNMMKRSWRSEVQEERRSLIDLGKASSRSEVAAQKTAVAVAYRKPAYQIGEQTCQIDRRQ